jgi:hypothetical protein
MAVARVVGGSGDRGAGFRGIGVFTRTLKIY